MNSETSLSAGLPARSPVRNFVRNIGFYKFVAIEEPEIFRERLHALCTAHELKGTIIIASEGINAMLAGAAADCAAFVDALDTLSDLAELSDVEIKISDSAESPFKKMKVKIKPEIVTMRVGALDPATPNAAHLAPETFRDWLRSGEPMVVIDTRNDYECELGTFRGAINPDTRSFHEFPDYLRAHQDELNAQKVVMFCTGGIRCEKATRWMLQNDFNEVYQLDGGVLNYFARVEDAERDWEGDLFIFDERVGLDTNLNETGATLCRECGSPIAQEQNACGCQGA